MMTRRLFAPGLAALAGACSPLRTFNAVIPTDPGARLVARGLPYGPDPRQAFDVYAPRAAGPWPLVVFFYGGSWNSGERGGYGWAGRALAAQGFLVALPDYRLVPQVRYPAFVDDAAAAVAEARRQASRLGGDPDRVFLAGHSAGAYIAAQVVLERSFLIRAGVPEAAIRGVAGLAGPYDFLPFDVASSRAAFGSFGQPERTQPANLARGDAPPFWLATGDADSTVQPRNSETLAERLRAAGGRAEVVVYPGVDHIGIILALARPFRGRAPVLAELTAFLRRHAAT